MYPSVQRQGRTGNRQSQMKSNSVLGTASFAWQTSKKLKMKAQRHWTNAVWCYRVMGEAVQQKDSKFHNS